MPLDELTEIPLALLYWEESAARERAELISDMRNEGRKPQRRGVANADTMAAFLNPLDSSRASQKMRGLPGRIVFLNTRTLQLTPFPGAPVNSRPLAWSRDHRKLLFTSTHLDGGRSQIFEYDLDRREVSKLTRGPRYHLEADYGPDGRILVSWLEVMAKNREAGMDIRSSSGGADVELVRGFSSLSPKWSPAGDRMIYVRAEARGPLGRDPSTIFSRDPSPDALVAPLSRGREPVFTPNGDWVVYTRQTAEGWRLQRMRPDGSARSQLGQGSLDARWPVVSPDGRHVAYVSNEDGIDRLYLRRMDGSGDRILLPRGGVAFPVW